MQTVDLQQHEMRAAFMHASTHSWVYMETTMTPTFQHLLSLIPGVISLNHGPIKFFIDILDCIGIITLPKLVEAHFEVGHWARILRGLYKDDISLVASIETWGVSLLLVSHLPPAWDDCDLTTTNRKQKRHQQTSHPPPALFDAFQFVTSYGGSFVMLPHEEPRYTIGSWLFEFGLIWGAFNYHMISSDVIFLPISLASAFHESGHPTMKYASIPPPHK